MRVFIENIARQQIIDDKYCRRLIARILQAENCCQYSLTLVLADDRILRQLNRRFRNQDRPTDVISFALMEGPPHPTPNKELGDIYISLSRARIQARQYGITPQEELVRLIIHGVLHLLGYDHLKPREARLMKEREAKYLHLCEAFYARKESKSSMASIRRPK